MKEKISGQPTIPQKEVTPVADKKTTGKKAPAKAAGKKDKKK